MSSSFAKTSLPVIPLEKVRIYNNFRHHLTPNNKASDVVDAARNLLGLHSARLSTPYVTLCSRMVNFQPQDLQHKLYTSHELIKLRCMRKTLHIVPVDFAGIVHQATLAFRVTEAKRILRQYKVSNVDLNKLREIIIEIVQKAPSSGREIFDLVSASSQCVSLSGQYKNQWKKIVATVIKNLWEEGTLCYINTSLEWGAEVRIYGYTANIFPQLDWEDFPPATAQKLLIHYYLHHYGPVTIEDISWWSGLGQKLVKRYLAEDLHNELSVVCISKLPGEFYMTRKTFDEISSLDLVPSQMVHLLAYEDPSLKGYFSSRERYIDSKYYHQLFNQIGEARASIALDGEVIGIWSWGKKAQGVQWKTFEPIPEGLKKKIEQTASQLEACLS